MDLHSRRLEHLSVKVSSVSEAWDELEKRIQEIEDIGLAIKLSHWDQEVMMPEKGGPARARSLATLQAISHDRLIDPEVGRLLEELAADDSLDATKKASVRILKRDYDKATKVPERLVRELAELEATAYQVWTKARPANDFAMLEPHLSKMIALKKEQADAVGWEDERYNALLDDFEPGMTAKEVEVMFEELAGSLRPVVDRIIEAAGPRPAFLGRSFDTAKQEEFCQWMVADLGFDTDGGRLDTSPHPFTMPVGPGDVRQTTRTAAGELMMSIYAGIHETGHAIYEQHLPAGMLGLPVGQVPSLGMHESQSRLWENQVGRSSAYCGYLLPHLAKRFPEELGGVDADEFYRGANHPSRSLIRVSADEVTYNLHVALRFELELALFRDELAAKDLPGAWNEAMQKWLGVIPPDDSDGVLQDMHWSIGALGYFPTYTLGTLYAAAFFDKAERSLGGLDQDLAAGDTSRLLGWLKENIYDRAYLYPAKDLGEKVLGEPLSARPFIDYLTNKYSEMLSLSL
jgi:carboxypeptidase Taq